MTYYNIEKLDGLQSEFVEMLVHQTSANEKEVLNLGMAVADFIDFLKEKENASFFDPNQLELPFPDEDNSK